jgi:transcriptional regulator of acetoin/glycerol metabolism
MGDAREVTRRVTGSEEAELRRATQQLRTAERTATERQAERDQLIADIAAAGGRVSEIASILGVSRAAVYDAIVRAHRAE